MSCTFLFFEEYKNLLLNTGTLSKSQANFVAGSLGGTTSVFFTYPLDCVRARLATQTTTMIGSTINTTTTATMTAATATATTATATATATAACATTIPSIPTHKVSIPTIANKQTHIHNINNHNHHHYQYRGVIDALMTISRTEGVLALYKGLSATIMGVAPYAGLKVRYI